MHRRAQLPFLTTIKCKMSSSLVSVFFFLSFYFYSSLCSYTKYFLLSFFDFFCFMFPSFLGAFHLGTRLNNRHFFFSSDYLFFFFAFRFLIWLYRMVRFNINSRFRSIGWSCSAKGFITRDGSILWDGQFYGIYSSIGWFCSLS